MSGQVVQLQQRSDGGFVEATLLDGMVADDFIVVGNEWSPERSVVLQELLQSTLPRRRWPQSLHWDWRLKAPMLNLLAVSGFGLVCDQQWQGVMVTKTTPYAARLAADKGKPLVYVDFLEVAPWNWVIPEIGRLGRFRAVGSTLLWRAVKQSMEEGFRGRVGLHSLPQAEEFYRKFGLTPFRRDGAKQNLLYMELSAERAMKLFETEG